MPFILKKKKKLISLFAQVITCYQFFLLNYCQIWMDLKIDKIIVKIDEHIIDTFQFTCSYNIKKKKNYIHQGFSFRFNLRPRIKGDMFYYFYVPLRSQERKLP